MRRRILSGATTVVALALVTGCAAGGDGATAASLLPASSPPKATIVGTKPTVTSPVDDGPPTVDAAWLDGGRNVGLVTWRESCSIVKTAKFSAGTLRVEFHSNPLADCESVAHRTQVSVIETPEQLDPQEDIRIFATGAGVDGSVTLPGSPVELERGSGSTSLLPSAGWTRHPGRLLLLEWGSPCAWDASLDTELNDNELVVTITAKDKDAPCWSSLEPVPFVIDIDPADRDADIDTVVVRGDEFDPASTPIIGQRP